MSDPTDFPSFQPGDRQRLEELRRINDLAERVNSPWRYVGGSSNPMGGEAGIDSGGLYAVPSPIDPLFPVRIDYAEYLMDDATVSVAGGGYAVSDTITLAGDRVDAILEVLTVSDTTTFGVGTIQLLRGGVFNAVPANPVAQDTTTGGGAGATFDLSFIGDATPTLLYSWTELAPDADGVFAELPGGRTGLTPDSPAVNLASGTVPTLSETWLRYRVAAPDDNGVLYHEIDFTPQSLGDETWVEVGTLVAADRWQGQLWSYDPDAAPGSKWTALDSMGDVYAVLPNGTAESRSERPLPSFRYRGIYSGTFTADGKAVYEIIVGSRTHKDAFGGTGQPYVLTYNKGSSTVPVVYHAGAAADLGDDTLTLSPMLTVNGPAVSVLAVDVLTFKTTSSVTPTVTGSGGSATVGFDAGSASSSLTVRDQQAHVVTGTSTITMVNTAGSNTFTVSGGTGAASISLAIAAGSSSVAFHGARFPSGTSRTLTTGETRDCTFSVSGGGNFGAGGYDNDGTLINGGTAATISVGGHYHFTSATEWNASTYLNVRMYIKTSRGGGDIITKGLVRTTLGGAIDDDDTFIMECSGDYDCLASDTITVEVKNEDTIQTETLQDAMLHFHRIPTS